MVNLQRFGNGESPVASAKLNLIVDSLTGAGNTPVNHGGVNDPINYALTVRNQDAAGKAAIIYAPDGVTVLFQVTAAGVLASAAGGAASAIVTPAATQTLTNKTFDATSNVISRIATVGPLGGTAASMVFSTIPQTYRHLRLEVYARGDAVTTSTGLRVQLDGDTLAHYYTQRMNASAATVTAGESLADTSARVGLIPAATASSTLMGATTITLLHYAQANKEKSLHAEGFCPTAISTGTMTVTAEGGFWDNPAAITQITLLPAAGNFTADSVAVLYGMP